VSHLGFWKVQVNGLHGIAAGIGLGLY